MLALVDATGDVMDIDAISGAAHATLKPNEALGWQSISAQSGNLTVVAAGTTTVGGMFSFRNISANKIMVRRFGVGLICTTGFTAAQLLDMSLFVARGFTASDTGGTVVDLSGSNGKHMTSGATLTSVDCRMATTAGLTAGTRTLDATPVYQTGVWATAAAAGMLIAPARDNVFNCAGGEHPIVLAQNEGIILRNNTLWGAAGICRLFVNMELAEVVSYPA